MNTQAATQLFPFPRKFVLISVENEVHNVVYNPANKNESTNFVKVFISQCADLKFKKKNRSGEFKNKTKWKKNTTPTNIYTQIKTNEERIESNRMNFAIALKSWSGREKSSQHEEIKEAEENSTQIHLIAPCQHLLDVCVQNVSCLCHAMHSIFVHWLQ